MELWKVLVMICSGTLTIGSLFMVGVKIANGINKKCPCPDVCALQEKAKKYDEILPTMANLVTIVEQLKDDVEAHSMYFSNDSRSIKGMDKRLAIVEIRTEGTDKKVDRIDENVIELMKRGAFGG